MSSSIRRSPRLAAKLDAVSLSPVKGIANTFIRRSPRLLEKMGKAKKEKQVTSKPVEFVEVKPKIETPEEREIHNSIKYYLDTSAGMPNGKEKQKFVLNLFYFLWEEDACLNFLEKFTKFREGVTKKCFEILGQLDGQLDDDIELKDEYMYVLTGLLHEISKIKGRGLGKLCDCCEH